MSMLQQWATGDNSQSSAAEYTYELPNTEPTGTAYVNWKAKNYATTRQRNLGAGDTNSSGTSDGNKADGTSVVDDITNKWYNLCKMLKLRKILKRESKYNPTNMAA